MGLYELATYCFYRPVYVQVTESTSNHSGHILRVDQWGAWIVHLNLSPSDCQQKGLNIFYQLSYQGSPSPLIGSTSGSAWVHLGSTNLDYEIDNDYIEDFDLFVQDLQDKPLIEGQTSVWSANWCCNSNRIKWNTFGDHFNPLNNVTFHAPINANYRISLSISQLLDGNYDSMDLITPYSVISVSKNSSEVQYFTVCLLEGQVLWLRISGQSPSGEFSYSSSMTIAWSTHDLITPCPRPYHETIQNDAPQEHLQVLEMARNQLGQTKLPDGKRKRLDFAYNQLEDIWKQ